MESNAFWPELPELCWTFFTLAFLNILSVYLTGALHINWPTLIQGRFPVPFWMNFWKIPNGLFSSPPPRFRTLLKSKQDLQILGSSGYSWVLKSHPTRTWTKSYIIFWCAWIGSTSFHHKVFHSNVLISCCNILQFNQIKCMRQLSLISYCNFSSGSL